MSGSAKFASAWRSATQGIRHGPFVHAVAVLTLTIALFTLGLARSGDALVQSLLDSLGGSVTVTVYLKDGTPPADIETLTGTLESQIGGTTVLVTPRAALERLARELPELSGLVESMSDNPLPASLELTMPEGQRDPEALRRLSDVLARVPAVEEVEWGEESVTRLSAMARGLRLAGLAAFLVVLLTTITVVAATLQLAIYARREEIEIQKLVGATDRFVRVPFILEGLMQGLLGGLLALGALALFARLAVPQLKSVLGFLLAQEFPVHLITPRLGVELLVGGAALGLLGSMLAVRRFLRV